MLVCYTAVFRVVTKRSSPLGGALRDDAKDGRVADYVHVGKLLFPFSSRLAVS